MNGSRVVVVGQVARDLVLRVEDLPEEGGSARATDRIERLGGKGANQAVGLRQLGADVALVGVAGADDVGRAMLEEAAASGIDTGGVVRRGATALLVDLVSGAGVRRLVEHVPAEALLTPDDVEAARSALRAASTLSLQLQQPGEALLAAVRHASPRARIVLDGAAAGPAAHELLAEADVLRADATEAELWTGEGLFSQEDAQWAAEQLLARGPDLVALAVAGSGDLLAWSGGSRFFPHAEAEVVDPTGGGDAFVAGLIAALESGATPEQAGELATAAASSTVARLGGRPDLGALRRRES